MAQPSPTVLASFRIEPDLLDEFKQLIATEERDLSKDLRLYIRKRVEKSRRETTKAAA